MAELELSLPKEVNFASKHPHFPENMTTNLITVLPTNGSSFRAGSVVSFSLPARSGLYLDGKTAFIRYKMKYTSGATAADNYIKATPAVAPFAKLDEYINSTLVQSVQQYNQVANMYVNTHLGVSEKLAVQTALFSEYKAGVVANDSLGDAVQVTASQASLAGQASFSFPIVCSALVSMDKFLPTGLAGQYRLELTLAQLADIALKPASGVTDYQIENIELCVNAMDLGVGVDQMVASMGESLFIKATGWANQGCGQIASNSTGTFTMVANHRFQSINNLYLLSCGADSTKDINGIYDSRDITSTNGQYSFTVGSQSFPQLPINTAVNKAGVLQYLRECTSSVSDWRYSMSINATEFSSYLGTAAATAINGFTATAVTTITEPAKFIVGVPISKIQNSDVYSPNSMLSGVSAAQAPILCNITIGTATGQAYNEYVIAEYDILLKLDPVSRMTSVIA